MLVAVNGDGVAQGQCCANAIGARRSLGPVGAGPQAVFLKLAVMCGPATPIDGNAFVAGQDHTAAQGADGLKQSVQRGGGGHDQGAKAFQKYAKLGLC